MLKWKSKKFIKDIWHRSFPLGEGEGGWGQNILDLTLIPSPKEREATHSPRFSKSETIMMLWKKCRIKIHSWCGRIKSWSKKCSTAPSPSEKEVEDEARILKREWTGWVKPLSPPRRRNLGGRVITWLNFIDDVINNWGFKLKPQKDWFFKVTNCDCRLKKIEYHKLDF